MGEISPQKTFPELSEKMLTIEEIKNKIDNELKDQTS